MDKKISDAKSAAVTPPSLPFDQGSRLQLALNVEDLDEAIDFYSQLFATPPTKVKPGYANFTILDPPLKLVLFEAPGHGGTINHLGVEVKSSEAVTASSSRLEAVGLAPQHEAGTACCYAIQDKVWVRGPSNEQWEIYTVLEDTEQFSGPSQAGITDGPRRQIKPETDATRHALAISSSVNETNCCGSHSPASTS
ncbi:MAG: VOC family protein [Acidimicrobiales bacterium]|nr:VOC family protein [Acidimicrobiales bacterium]